MTWRRALSGAINNVHIAQADVLQSSGNIPGGSTGASQAGIFTPFGSSVPTIMQSLVLRQPPADAICPFETTKPTVCLPAQSTISRIFVRHASTG